MVLKWTPFYIKTAHGLHKKNPDILNPLKWTAGAGVLGDGKINIKRCSPPPSGLYTHTVTFRKYIYIFQPFCLSGTPRHKRSKPTKKKAQTCKFCNWRFSIYQYTPGTVWTFFSIKNAFGYLGSPPI